MSRTLKVLIALTAIVLLWKFVISGSASDDVDVEFEPEPEVETAE